eukprot:TRINITY_DN4730_c0_g1_i6.p1 TRINITY_DN4730_c0_g1~~TRINITY_DN4730_c0_g1_i6.p1  ORF type:complete len:292 (-),score=-44.75 TRINITY_DN4730_c0_g1_i6:349-1224(-)
MNQFITKLYNVPLKPAKISSNIYKTIQVNSCYIQRILQYDELIYYKVIQRAFKACQNFFKYLQKNIDYKLIFVIYRKNFIVYRFICSCQYFTNFFIAILCIYNTVQVNYHYILDHGFFIYAQIIYIAYVYSYFYCLSMEVYFFCIFLHYYQNQVIYFSSILMIYFLYFIWHSLSFCLVYLVKQCFKLLLIMRFIVLPKKHQYNQKNYVYSKYNVQYQNRTHIKCVYVQLVLILNDFFNVIVSNISQKIVTQVVQYVVQTIQRVFFDYVFIRFAIVIIYNHSMLCEEFIVRN